MFYMFFPLQNWKWCWRNLLLMNPWLDSMLQTTDPHPHGFELSWKRFSIVYLESQEKFAQIENHDKLISGSSWVCPTRKNASRISPTRRFCTSRPHMAMTMLFLLDEPVLSSCTVNVQSCSWTPWLANTVSRWSSNSHVVEPPLEQSASDTDSQAT